MLHDAYPLNRVCLTANWIVIPERENFLIRADCIPYVT